MLVRLDFMPTDLTEGFFRLVHTKVLNIHITMLILWFSLFKYVVSCGTIRCFKQCRVIVIRQ